MVCNRCIMVVEDILKRNGVEPVSVSLGTAELATTPDPEQLKKINASLEEVGFEVLEDQKKKLVEQIKSTILRELGNEEREKNFSRIIANAMHKDYSYLSKLFSEVEGITIEKYIIDQKIEKVKELLVYGELSLTEIAYQLNYSSVGHLSSQFKKITGFNPTEFRKQKNHLRRPTDKI